MTFGSRISRASPSSQSRTASACLRRSCERISAGARSEKVAAAMPAFRGRVLRPEREAYALLRGREKGAAADAASSWLWLLHAAEIGAAEAAMHFFPPTPGSLPMLSM